MNKEEQKTLDSEVATVGQQVAVLHRQFPQWSDTECLLALLIIKLGPVSDALDNVASSIDQLGTSDYPLVVSKPEY